MKTLYTKIIDGNKVIKTRNNIVLKKVKTITDPETGENKDITMNVFNPTEEMLLEDGWEIYTTPELTPEQILTNAKREKKHNINNYDSSANVNEFYIQDMPV